MTPGHRDPYPVLRAERDALFVVLLLINWKTAWRSRKSAEGRTEAGWIFAGLVLPTGVEVVHTLPAGLWGALGLLTTFERAPEWDGHTTEDASRRLLAWGAVIEKDFS